jgi:hypothetical protein
VKPGTLTVQAKEVACVTRSGGVKTYNCTGESALQLSVDGKKVLSVTGDSRIIQDLKPGSE